jgi:hypothetical protein
MIEVTEWINTLLLLFILWFQWNRNKTLSERIDHQTKLVQDTKSVVTQQATALESQAKVVETAVRYSEAFDPVKMENVLRKKIEIDSYEKIANLEKEYQQGLADKDEKYKKLLNGLLNIAVEATSTAVKDHIKSFIDIVIGLMVRVPTNDRDALIDDLPDSTEKDWLKHVSKKVDEESNKALSRLLADDPPQPDS